MTNLIIDPLHMFWLIRIKGFSSMNLHKKSTIPWVKQIHIRLEKRSLLQLTYLRPLNKMSIFNAMSSIPRGFCKSAQRKLDLRWEKPNCALKTGCNSGHDNSSMTLESFGSPIYHRFDCFSSWGIIFIILYSSQPHDQREKKKKDLKSREVKKLAYWF